MNQTDLHIHSVYSNDRPIFSNETATWLPLPVSSLWRLLVTMLFRGSARRLFTSRLEIPSRGYYSLSIGLYFSRIEPSSITLGYGISFSFFRIFCAGDLACRSRSVLLLFPWVLHQWDWNLMNKKPFLSLIMATSQVRLLLEVALQDPRNNGFASAEAYRPGGKRSDNPYVNFTIGISAHRKNRPMFPLILFLLLMLYSLSALLAVYPLAAASRQQCSQLSGSLYTIQTTYNPRPLITPVKPPCPNSL